MVVDAELGQTTTHTFRVHHIPDRGPQLPDVEAEIGHTHIQDRYPERLRGEEEEEEEEEEEVQHHLEVRRDEDGGAQATVLTAAIVEVAVEPEAGPGAGEVMDGGDDPLPKEVSVLYKYPSRKVLHGGVIGQAFL